jgi:PhnB protein
MYSINPYLSFNDNCEEAFEFYRSVFGGEFTTVMRFGDVPDNSDFKEHRKIMHMELPIGSGPALMGSDTPGSFDPVRTGTNFHISLQVDSQQEADRVFAGLSVGGKVIVPMAQAFWGAYFGMLVDRYEVQWMISYALHPAR